MVEISKVRTDEHESGKTGRVADAADITGKTLLVVYRLLVRKGNKAQEETVAVDRDLFVGFSALSPGKRMECWFNDQAGSGRLGRSR